MTDIFPQNTTPTSVNPQFPRNLSLLIAQANNLAREANVPMSTTELAYFLGDGINASDIGYWIKNEILLSGRSPNKKKHIFDREEVSKALVAKDLQKLGWKPRHIGAFMTLWNADLLPEGPVSPHSDLDLSGRGGIMLRARLLGIAISIAFGLERIPRDCQLIARKCEPPLGAKSSFLFNKIGPREIMKVLDEEDLLIGWSDTTDSREISVSFKPSEKFHSKTTGRTYLSIQLRSEIDLGWYELIMGVVDNSPDTELLELIRNYEIESLNHNPKPPYKDLLNSVLDYLFRVAVDLEALLIDTGNLHIISHIDSIPSTILNSILLFNPLAWDYAAFFVSDDLNRLRVLTGTKQLPRAIKDSYYPLTPEQKTTSLIGWVFRRASELIIENIEAGDPRIPKNEQYFPVGSSLAIVPAMIDSEIVGVLMVGGLRKHQENAVFSDTSIQILYELASIVGESYKRVRLAQRPKDLFSKYKPSITQQNKNDLIASLENISKLIAPIVKAGSGYDTNIVFIAVQIKGAGITSSSNISEWYVNNVISRLDYFIDGETEDMWDNPNSTNVYILNSESSSDVRLVGLVGRSYVNLKHLMVKFREILMILDEIKQGIKVELYGWLVPFSYQEIYDNQELAAIRTEKKFLEVSQHLLGRVEGALDVLVHISKGNDFLQEKNYAEAFIEFRKAYNIDPTNPYTLRHLAECGLGLKNNEEAYKYAIDAVQLDPVAGSYQRLGETYIKMKDYNKAIEAYNHAIKQTPNDPEILLELGHAFLCMGIEEESKTKFQKAIDLYSQAKENDDQRILEPSYYYLYIAKAEILSGEREMAENFLNKALYLSSNNLDVKWVARNIFASG